MNYSDPSNERRQRLMTALLGHAPSATSAVPLFGGAGRGSAGGSQLPMAALPSLTFNPFLAQLQHGIPGLQAPTHATDPQPGPPQGAGGPPAGVGGPPAGAGAPAPPFSGTPDPNQVYGGDPTTYFNPNDAAMLRMFGNGPFNQRGSTQTTTPLGMYGV